MNGTFWFVPKVGVCGGAGNAGVDEFKVSRDPVHLLVSRMELIHWNERQHTFARRGWVICGSGPDWLHIAARARCELKVHGSIFRAVISQRSPHFFCEVESKYYLDALESTFLLVSVTIRTYSRNGFTEMILREKE